MKEPKVIAFDRRLGVGDIISSLPALYVIKQLYPRAKLLLFTSKVGFYLCKNFDFIDRIFLQGLEFTQNDENLPQIIDEYNIDTLILAHRTSKNIKFAKQSKCKNIITWRHLHTLFSPRFKHPKHIKRLKRLEIQRCLDLVRMIDPKRYDAKIKEFDLKTMPIQIQSDRENIEYINAFLKPIQKDFKHIIGLSCFGISSAHYNLKMNDWVELTKALAGRFKNFLFVFMNFKQSGYEFEDFKEENIKVFNNDENLLHLVELTRRLKLCISLSTGNIHIADNLKIDTLGFYPQTDSVLFPCGNYGGHFDALFLPKDWHNEYEFYKDEFYKLAQKVLSKFEE
ncbi:hypothetical protein CQA38_01755 [Campylobacter sp. MIT 12-5580]|uniref:glycosyltransferase family 9 protein n=1 Tax=Campylobacter sp. MIT 12-5580 TaxID=2040651 RepID=UPI0010FA1181|nr:glycosyltransferase family 9 protein [Campylobacter sp. MIT 12-5580]TKX30385.1 hypothetical protein CQA38_01755 [Campylobacter sp. MIT 12-5580]